ncbi:hypothetical protein JG688_00017895 [Phytophthora aleatoria]|uniref:Uncharacterized protein n=1 Tax=Phytophthora aleatoria TaxID=2496075 RepID=A0A8J5MBV6_9STRA|nr:hypothetical protein JG688_00017895 [Phytophthora aleatoria]
MAASSSSTEVPSSSALANAPATRPNIPDVRLSRQSFQDLLREVNHEVSEHVISTLVPQIETADRISVDMQLGSPVRGNKRINARFVAARSLQEVADSVVPDSGNESETTSQELARLRSEIYSTQAAQATAEASLTQEIMRPESAQMACSSARRQQEQTQRAVHRLRERESSVLHELDAFNAQVDAHNELYQRLENRIKLADDESQRLTQYTARQKEIFKATVATNTSQIRRLHQLLSDSDIADDSATTRIKRRNEDLCEQVKRLSSAHKALRACLSTGGLNWELLDVSGQTRDILNRLYAMKDSTMSDENFAAGLARIACREVSASADAATTSVFAHALTAATEFRLSVGEYQGLQYLKRVEDKAVAPLTIIEGSSALNTDGSMPTDYGSDICDVPMKDGEVPVASTP